jgi:hypothetical protein
MFDQLQHVMSAPQTLLYRKGYGGRSSATSLPKATLIMPFPQAQMIAVQAPVGAATVVSPTPASMAV